MLFALDDDELDDTVGRPRESALRARKTKNKKMTMKRARSGFFCQRLASAKHRPAWVLMCGRRGYSRGPKEFRDRQASYSPKPHPLRCVTREVGGRLVTENVEAKTPMNRPGLRDIFPVMTAERKQTWDMMADTEDNFVAWDDLVSLPDDNVDVFGDAVDQAAPEEHGQATGLRREEGAAAPSESEASSTKASGSQGKKGKKGKKAKKADKTKKPEKGKSAEKSKKRSRDDEDDDADDDAEIKQDMQKRRKRAKAPSPEELGDHAYAPEVSRLGEDPTHPPTLPPTPPPTSSRLPAMPGAFPEEPAAEQNKAEEKPDEPEPQTPQPRALKRLRDEEDTQDLSHDTPPHPYNPRPAKRARRRTT